MLPFLQTAMDMRCPVEASLLFQNLFGLGHPQEDCSFYQDMTFLSSLVLGRRKKGKLAAALLFFFLSYFAPVSPSLSYGFSLSVLAQH